MELIGDRRAFLMGISILLIMFCHYTIKWPVCENHFYVFAQLAQCGVDVFFFYQDMACIIRTKKEVDLNL